MHQLFFSLTDLILNMEAVQTADHLSEERIKNHESIQLSTRLLEMRHRTS